MGEVSPTNWDVSNLLYIVIGVKKSIDPKYQQDIPARLFHQFLVGVSFSFHRLGLREDDLQAWIYVFTDSTMVNHHFSPPCGRICFLLFFISIEQANPSRGMEIYFVAGGSNYPPKFNIAPEK